MILGGIFMDSWVFTVVQRCRPLKRQVKPLVFEVSFFDGIREGFEGTLSEHPRMSTTSEGSKSRGSKMCFFMYFNYMFLLL